MKPAFLVILFLPFTAICQKLSIETVECQLKDAEKVQIERIAKFEAKFYNSIFDTNINDSLPVTINLFGKEIDYKVFQAEVAGTEISATGFYSGRTREIYVYKHKDFIRTLLHETSHSLLHNNFGNPPIWLNEGLAVFMGSLVIDHNEIYYSADASRIRRMIFIINAGNLNLTSYLNQTAWTSKSELTDNYTIAYSIIYYLVKKKPGGIKQVAELMKQRYTSAQAIAYLFGDFNAFETEFKNFYRLM